MEQEKKEFKKFKTCEVSQYLEFCDLKTIDQIEQAIKTLTNIKTYAFIIHDKDVLPNGELKKPHFHAVLTFSNATTIELVANALHVKNNYVERIKTTTKSAQQYLIHWNDKTKYQYDPSDVISNFVYESILDTEPRKNNKEKIANLIANGEIKAYNLFDYITADDYGKNKVYYDRCFQYRIGKLQGVNRDMKCLFLSGKSGTGKTTLAKFIAESMGYKKSIYISSGGKNPLDNYKGQSVIILDDLRDSTYRLSDFLKLTDNNTDSEVGCRFYNKSISECKYLIVTSIHSIKEFYCNALNPSENEERVQLYRRFSEWYDINELNVVMYQYDQEKQDYIVMESMPNPIHAYFEMQKEPIFKSALSNVLQSMQDDLKSKK